MTPESTYTTPACKVVRSNIWGEPVFFTITNPRDAIQRSHVSGVFYEPEELEIIRRHCPPGAVFCDIGANIGNHALFALKYLRAAKVIVFEPNPAAIDILMSNITLNGVMDRCDTTWLGVGLSDAEASGFTVDFSDRNMGGGRMKQGDGTLRTIRGDEALAGHQVDFIKIDIEGMEMRALAGLSETIARCRPRMFIEVDNVNAAAFAEWVDANHYRVRDRFRRYRANENFLIVPKPLRPQPAGQ